MTITGILPSGPASGRTLGGVSKSGTCSGTALCSSDTAQSPACRQCNNESIIPSLSRGEILIQAMMKLSVGGQVA